jgi:hypothetical protein
MGRSGCQFIGILPKNLNKKLQISVLPPKHSSPHLCENPSSLLLILPMEEKTLYGNNPENQYAFKIYQGHARSSVKGGRSAVLT